MAYSIPHTIFIVLLVSCLIFGLPYLIYHYTDNGSTTQYVVSAMYLLFVIEFLYYFVFHRQYYTSINMFMMGEPAYSWFLLKESIRKTLRKPFPETEEQMEKRGEEVMKRASGFALKDMQRINSKERELKRSETQVMKTLRNRKTTF